MALTKFENLSKIKGALEIGDAEFANFGSFWFVFYTVGGGKHEREFLEVFSTVCIHKNISRFLRNFCGDAFYFVQTIGEF